MNNIASYLSVLMRYKQESRNWYKSEHNCNFAACPNAADTQLLLCCQDFSVTRLHLQENTRIFLYFSVFLVL